MNLMNKITSFDNVRKEMLRDKELVEEARKNTIKFGVEK